MPHLQEDQGQISLLLGDLRAVTHQRFFEGNVEGAMILLQLPPVPTFKVPLEKCIFDGEDR
jgi:hypothetical protein